MFLLFELFFKKIGYEEIWKFYAGQSLFNKSLVGWNGHTVDGGTIGSIEG